MQTSQTSSFRHAWETYSGIYYSNRKRISLLDFVGERKIHSVWEGGCWCHQWSEVASVFSALSGWSKKPLAEKILMHPDGNFTKSSYCGTLHFLILLLEPISLYMLAEKMGAADATVGSLTPPGLCRSLNNWWNMYLSPSGLVQSHCLGWDGWV